MSRVQDQQPIQTLCPGGPNESFRDPIRLRRLNRRAHDSCPLTFKYRIEAARKLPVVIANQKTNRCRAISERPRELSRLLRDPLRSWVARTAGQVHTAVLLE